MGRSQPDRQSIARTKTKIKYFFIGSRLLFSDYSTGIFLCKFLIRMIFPDCDKICGFYFLTFMEIRA